jgi:hypothetical protein
MTFESISLWRPFVGAGRPHAHPDDHSATGLGFHPIWSFADQPEKPRDFVDGAVYSADRGLAFASSGPRLAPFVVKSSPRIPQL